MSELPRSRCAQYPSQAPLLRSLGNLLKTAVLVNILFDGTSAICPKCAEMKSAHFALVLLMFLKVLVVNTFDM